MDAWITGIGIVSPYGVGRDIFWQHVVAGECALRPIERFDASPYRSQLGGEVPGFDPGGRPRAAALALAAAEEAIRHAGLDGSKTGLVLGTNFSGMSVAEAALADTYGGDATPRDLSGYLGGSTLEAIKKELALDGPSTLLSLSCASGAAALGTALDWIRLGRAEAVLAGGFDELSETAVAGLSALRAITKDAVRPFDKNRGGTIFSEGACVMTVESAERARARGATCIARLVGRGLNNDAFHMTAPDKTGAGIGAVMEMALADAKIEPATVVHLNCHGTGTKYNDLIETTAIRRVFGEHAGALVLTANKSLFGHAMGAAGALEAAATCLSIRDGVVPPTIGLEERDPELDLDVCFETARTMPVPFAMTNSYGLGGTNASLVLAAPHG